jgi:hypothetical protein
MVDLKRAGELGWMLDERLGHSPTTGVRLAHSEVREIRDLLFEVAGKEAGCEHCGDTGIEPCGISHDAGDGEGEDRPCSVCG